VFDATPSKDEQRAKFDISPYINSVIDYAIISLDPDGNVSSWNTGATRLKGYSADEIIGQHFSKFYTPMDIESGLPLKLLRQAEELGHVEHTGWRLRKDGTRFWGDVIITAVHDESGDLVGFAKITRDLTERRLAEERERNLTIELERANRMKSAFLANMSHEIRTPLNGIIGMLTLLQDGSLSGEQRDLVDTAHSSSNALLRIVNDILDFSKVEAGRLELEKTPFYTRELMQEVCDLFEPQARAKSVSLLLTLDSALPSCVLGDVGRLRQVLANLVGNAVKFTSEGSVQMSAFASQRVDNGVKVRFEVKDTGVGISEENRHRLFEAFTQADLSTTRRFGGTGLGLSISQQLTRLMGGSINVVSQLGEGSSFSFEVTFPLAESSAEQPAIQKVADTSTNVALSGSVLLAEDNEVNQQVASLFLQRLGFDVTVANNGQEAIDALQAKEFDVVLMDCQMPVLDGYEATRKIRKMEGPNANIPIVAVTASAMPEERKRCFDAGMNDFISKPIFPGTLNEALKRAMNNRNADRGYTESLHAAMGGSMSRLIDVYAESAELQLETIARSLKTGDVDTAVRAAHTLKGGSSAVAADRMTDYARRIESALREQDTAQAIDLCREAINIRSNVIDGLRTR
jgi:PAS domain S-box-containing protein